MARGHIGPRVAVTGHLASVSGGNTVAVRTLVNPGTFGRPVPSLVYHGTPLFSSCPGVRGSEEGFRCPGELWGYWCLEWGE